MSERKHLFWWFYIAHNLGMTVGRLQQEMSAIEFDYWRLFYMRRPFGERATDIRFAALSARFVQCFSDKLQRIEEHFAFKPKGRRKVKGNSFVKMVTAAAQVAKHG